DGTPSEVRGGARVVPALSRRRPRVPSRREPPPILRRVGVPPCGVFGLLARTAVAGRLESLEHAYRRGCHRHNRLLGPLTSAQGPTSALPSQRRRSGRQL